MASVRDNRVADYPRLDPRVRSTSTRLEVSMASPIAVAKAADIAAGKSIAVDCGPEPVAVFNVDGVFFACTNRCPHAGAPLQNGFLNGTIITCPWHGWRFDLAAGPDAPKDGVIRYPVTVENGEVMLHLPEAN